ncbi:MAG: hypothetical protein CVU00_13900 [Bacteroidetes bacterium HGW-Bacteroidetes-17]|jgi:hypothetical protein|nr:MAG: hypothetical protein CVU00_13900 [Bacteroidetes bacterium HGW-Bacteroidetes-17]
MEIIRFIEQWAYPCMSLVLFIFCILKLKSNYGIYFIIGFGIEFFNSLLWRLVPMIIKSEALSNFYDTYGRIGLFLSIISYTLLITGIIQLGNLLQILPKHQNPSMKKFGNFMVYVILLAIGIIPYLIGLTNLIEKNASYSEQASMLIFLIIGLIILLIAQIYFLIILHRVWQFSINESKRLNLVPTIKTPGQAIGYLFIPFYNFYWLFLAYGKISGDLNAIAKVKNVPKCMSGGLGITISILCIVNLIPFVGYFTSLISLILFPIFIYQLMNFGASLEQMNNTTENI